MTDEAPRYATLQDYLRVLRRRRLLIGLVTVGVTAAAFLVSIVQTPTYEAAATLQFRDLSQDLKFFDRFIPPDQSAAVRAASNAQLVDDPKVVAAVKKDLKTPLSVDKLASAVEGRVSTQTQAVVLQAEASSASFAAKLANTFAEKVRAAGKRDTIQLLEGFERAIESEVATLQRDATEPGVAFQIGEANGDLANLRTLKRIVEPVQIVSRAQPPGSAASPDTARNVILGAVVGLLFGLLGGFVRDSLDRRLHSVHDVHEELGLPVLGRVADTALGYPGLARNGPVVMNETDFESFRILRTNLGVLGSERPLRSLMVTSGLAEEGKSTVSMSLASATALTGQRVLLVECDLRRPSFAARLNIRRQPGLTDYLTGKAAPQDILQTVELTEPATFNGAGAAPRSQQAIATLVCISAGSPVANPAELLISDRFKGFLEKVTRAYDLVILDTSPLLAVVDPLELVPQVDGVIVCVRAQQATREEARASRAALNHLPERPMGAVVTGLRRGGPDAYEQYYYGD